MFQVPVGLVNQIFGGGLFMDNNYRGEMSAGQAAAANQLASLGQAGLQADVKVTKHDAIVHAINSTHDRAEALEFLVRSLTGQEVEIKDRNFVQPSDITIKDVLVNEPDRLTQANERLGDALSQLQELLI